MLKTKSELMRYLVKEQGYEEEEVKNMPMTEMLDLYEMYHED